MWLVALMVFRDLLIICGAWYFHYRVAPITSATPSTLSKWNTLFQIMLVVCVMLGLAFPGFQGPWTAWLIIFVAISTVLSGVQYVWVWSARASLINSERITREK
jgi:cardiolipin synthase